MSAVRATFEDVKRVKTRKVWQLIFEVPEENYDAAIAALGGSPQSGTDRWVGIARIKAPEKGTNAQTAPAETERPKGGVLAKRAGILCNNPAFISFLVNNYPQPSPPNVPPGLSMEGDAAAYIRGLCGVKSRAELDHNSAAAETFERIVYDFYASQRGQTDESLMEQRR